MRNGRNIVSGFIVVSLMILPQSALADVHRSKVKTEITLSDLLTSKSKKEITLSVRREFEKKRSDLLVERQYLLSTTSPSINPLLAAGMSFGCPFFTEYYFADNEDASLKYNFRSSANSGFIAGLLLDFGIPLTIALIGGDWRLFPVSLPYVVATVHPLSAIIGGISAAGHNNSEEIKRRQQIEEVSLAVRNHDSDMETSAIIMAISDAEAREKERIAAEKARKEREREEAEQRRLEAQRRARQQREEAKARAEQARIDAYYRNNFTQIEITGTPGTSYSGAIPGDSEYSTISVSGVVPRTYTIYRAGFVTAVIQNQGDSGYIEVVITKKGREVAREISFSEYGVVSVSAP